MTKHKEIKHEDRNRGDNRPITDQYNNCFLKETSKCDKRTKEKDSY